MDKTQYTSSSRPPAGLWYTRRMATKNLVESWLAAELAAGKTKTEAVAALRKACGPAYTLSRVGEWRNGIVQVPAKVRQHMIRVALRHVLEVAGVDVGRLSAAEIRKLADRLS